MSHHKIGFMGGFSAPGRLTPLTFGTGSTRPTDLTFHTIGIPERDISLNGPYRRQTRQGRLLTVQMMTSHQLCLGHHQGGGDERKHRLHGTPGPKSTSSSPGTQRSSPARPLTRDLAGKYGDPATSRVIFQGSNSAGSQNLSPGDSTLGTLLPTRSPRSESLPPVERPSFCDTGHNAPLATKGSVQQSSVDRPVYSEHAPVTPGPGSSSRRDNNIHCAAILLRHADPSEPFPASLLRHRVRIRSRSYNSVFPRHHNRFPLSLKREEEVTSSPSSHRFFLLLF